MIQPLKAHVKNGRLVLDDFDPEDRARLMQAIEDGEEDIQRGDHMDGTEFIAKMRTKREAAGR